MPLILVLVLGLAIAQPESVERSLADLDARFDAALAARDRVALDALLADGFAMIHSLDGRLDSRTFFLDQAARGQALQRQRAASATFDSTLSVNGATAIRTARVRSRHKEPERETWLRQMRVYVLDGAAWKLGAIQGTAMYDGPITTAELYARYAGTYVLDDKRSLRLEWDGDSLMATLPNGIRSQFFLKSPTEEAIAGPSRIHFVLDQRGNPAAARMVDARGEVWRAERK